MHFTTVTQKRANVTLRTGIPVQIESMSYQAALEQGGQIPYDSFWLYTTGGTLEDVQRGDLLIDETRCEQYRVFGNTETFFASHTEIPGERIIGT